jgi:SAM-dependent methyltransferase
MIPAQCNVCGAGLEPLFERVRDAQSDETFSIVRCSRCGLGHTSPQPDDLAPYYGEKYYGGRHSFTQRHCMARNLRLLQRAMRGSEGKKLLDVGCGDGSYLALAREHGFVVSGTELGDNAQPASRGIEARQTVDDWLDRAPFDVVTMWHSLEHFRDVRGALASVSRVLRPGGVLVVAVPDFGGLQARAFGPYWFHLDVPRHLFHFDRGALETLLRATDFDAFAWRHHESEQDVFGWMQSALNRALPQPNVLFQVLTGKPREASLPVLGASLAGGALLAPLAIPAALTSTALGRSATQIVFARKT